MADIQETWHNSEWLSPPKDIDLGSDPAFADLIARVQAGDGDAAQQLYAEYGPHLLRAVRRRLHQRLRQKFDSLDFTQDVWASFFVDNAGRFEISSPAQLANLLTTMARNKVAEMTRQRLMRHKHNINRELALDGIAGGGDSFPAAQPTPSQIVIGKEAWDQMLAGQPPVYRRILLLLRQGMNQDTIAEELGISKKMVQRVIRKIKP
jgi:RNA polymerase sigma factor (sigma-70 family)